MEFKSNRIEINGIWVEYADRNHGMTLAKVCKRHGCKVTELSKVDRHKIELALSIVEAQGMELWAVGVLFDGLTKVLKRKYDTESRAVAAVAAFLRKPYMRAHTVYYESMDIVEGSDFPSIGYDVNPVIYNTPEAAWQALQEGKRVTRAKVQHFDVLGHKFTTRYTDRFYWDLLSRFCWGEQTVSQIVAYLTPRKTK